MIDFNELYQVADWKIEKHVPNIELLNKIIKGKDIYLNLSVGKEIPHPNTTEHHIRWIKVYFKPQDEQFAYEIANLEFNAHGSSTKGPNTSTIYSLPNASISFQTEKSGTIIATSLCNIHGLWRNFKEITVNG